MTSGECVKHLWDCALAINTETHSKKLLKSYLINVCRRVAGTNSDIPLERFTASQMCQRCSTHWQENEFEMKLRPQTVKTKTSKARRLIAKFEAQQSGKEKGILTKKQKNRCKWLLKNAESRVEIKCNFCQHKTLIALNKPSKKKAQEKAIQNESDAHAIVENVKSKKKKKSKDVSAGLKIPKMKKDNTQNNLEAKKKVSNNNARLEGTGAVSKNVQSSSLKANKPKSKNPNKKEAPKVQSKIQKQNSLLQLAALLKSQDSNKKLLGSSSKNRLESLLE